MDWYDLLYVWGVTTEDNPMNVAEIIKLYKKYNEMFPDNQIDEEYVKSFSSDEIMEKLSKAIRNNEPIIMYYR